MIFFRGWGAIAGLVIAGLIGAGLDAIGVGRPVAYLIGGAAMAAFGWWLNATDEKRHDIFWIPVQWWGVAIAIAAVAGL